MSVYKNYTNILHLPYVHLPTIFQNQICSLKIRDMEETAYLKLLVPYRRDMLTLGRKQKTDSVPQ